MSIKLADMYVDLDLRTSGYAAQLAGATAATSKASASQGKLTKSSGMAAGAMSRLSTAAKAGGAALAVGAAYGAWKAAGAASDLEEALNKVNQVFGKSSGNIEKWSKNSAEKLLVSQSAALDAAGSFGAMLKPMGFTEKKAAAMSKRMVQLSADMASFNNVDPTDMLDRIQSGLSGEMEPLKRYGSVLSETRVAQYAYKEGIAATGAELTEQQKIQARYGLLLQDTKDQQGDVARTGEGMANSLRTLTANLTNLAAKVGTVLTPVIAGASNALNDFLGSILGGKGAGKMPGWLDSIIGWFEEAGRSELFRGFLDGVKSIGEEFSKFWNEDGKAIIGAFRNIGLAIKFVVDKWIIPVAERWLPPFFEAVKQIVRVVRGVVEVVTGVLTGDWRKAWEGIKNIVGGAISAVANLIAAGTAPMREAAARIGQGIKAAIGGAFRFIRDIAKGVLDKILGFWSSLLNATADVVDKLSGIPVLGDKFDGLADDIRGSANEIDNFRETLRGADNQVHEVSFRHLVRQLDGVKGATEENADALRRWLRQFGDSLDGAGDKAERGAGRTKTALGEITDKLQSNSRSADKWENALVGNFSHITKKSARMAVGVAGNVSSMANAVAGPGGGIDTLVSNTNKALSGLGVAKAKFVTYSPKKSGGGRPNVVTAQRGGVMVPGSGSGDKIGALLEPGEVVWNRHAVRAMGGAQRANAVNRKFPRFAGGGIVPGDTGGLHGSILGLVSSLYKRFGGSVSSGLRAGDSGSLHSTGQAADYVPADWKGASAAVNRIGGSLLEGIYNPGVHGGSPVSWDTGQRVPSSFWAAEWGNHLDHIHLAVADGTKAMISGMAAKLAEVLLKGPKGGITDLGNAILSRVHNQAEKYLASVMPMGYTGDGHTGALGGWKPGDVLKGRVSWFNGPSSSTASGLPVTTPGLALNIAPGTDAGWNNATTDAWVRAQQMFAVRIGGHKANLPVIDKGPAGSTGRAIDVTEAGVHRMGWRNANEFPTDSIGTATMLRRGGIVLLAKGGDPGKDGGKGKDDDKTVPGSVSEGDYYIKRLRKFTDHLKAISRRIARTDEKITVAEDNAGKPRSEAGTETGPGETKYQVRLSEHLLSMLKRTREIAQTGIERGKAAIPHTMEGMAQRRGIEALIKNWTGTVREMEGITGTGGRIHDTKIHLADLRWQKNHPYEGETNFEEVNALQAERIAALERALAVSQAQYGVFQGSFARGGRVPGKGFALVGERGPELISTGGGEQVSPLGEIRVVIEDRTTRVLVDGREVDAAVDRRMNSAARSKRYAGSGSLTRIGR